MTGHTVCLQDRTHVLFKVGRTSQRRILISNRLQFIGANDRQEQIQQQQRFQKSNHCAHRLCKCVPDRERAGIEDGLRPAGQFSGAVQVSQLSCKMEVLPNAVTYLLTITARTHCRTIRRFSLPQGDRWKPHGLPVRLSHESRHWRDHPEVHRLLP